MAITELEDATVPMDAVAQPKKTQTRREYVVLGCTDEREQEWWKLPENGWGFNEQTAKEDAVSKLPPDEQEGTFVGIPVRSWKPSTRALETRTRTRWS